MTIDLTAKTLTIPSYILRAGELVNIEFSIFNQGNDNAESFDIEFYLSTDNIITNEDTLLGKQTITGIAANSNTDLLVSKPNLSPSNSFLSDGNGIYYLGAIIDRNNLIVESDKNNNTITVDQSGKVHVVSVAPSSFNVVQRSANTGEKIDIRFSLDNLGDLIAENVEVEFYVSVDDWISRTDYKLGSFTINEIAESSNSGNQLVSFDLPPDSENLWRIEENGTYSVGMIIPGTSQSNQVKDFYTVSNSQFVDHDRIDIKVSNPVDPTGKSPEAVIEEADLIGEQFTVVQNDLLQPGDSIDINFKISNQGQANAGAYTVDLYLSNNEYISDHDFQLGSVDISSLAGESTTELLEEMYQLPDANHQIWDHLDGTYYVGMLIDRENEVKEITQLNNNNQGQFLDSDTISVAKSNLMDVFSIGFNVVEEATVAEPLNPGQNINLEYEIYNQSSDDIEFSAVGFYLFTEEYFNNQQQLSYNDILDNNPDINFIFGDRDSNFLEIPADRTTGKRTLEVELPENWDAFDRLGDGYYYIGVLSDQWDEVAEMDELNNSLTGELIDYEKIYIDVI